MKEREDKFKQLNEEKKKSQAIEMGIRGGILAIQPKLLDPHDEDALMAMRLALQSHLMQHVDSLRT